jgi:hypothetical protein
MKSTLETIISHHLLGHTSNGKFEYLIFIFYTWVPNTKIEATMKKNPI